MEYSIGVSTTERVVEDVKVEAAYLYRSNPSKSLPAIDVLGAAERLPNWKLVQLRRVREVASGSLAAPTQQESR